MPNPIFKLAIGKALQSDAVKLDKEAEQPLVMMQCPKCGYAGPEEEFSTETPPYEEESDEDEEDDEEESEF